MAQSPPSPDGRPHRRGDSTRPPRARRGGDRVPYPGARTHTATGVRATSRPAGTPQSSQPRTSTASSAPTPATVWTCGPEPVDAHELWPLPIVERITTAFTAPGGHVVLVNVATTTATSGTGDTATAGDPVPPAVQEAIRALGRTVTTTTACALADDSHAPARPFWADLILEPRTPSAAPAVAPTHPVRDAAALGDGRDGARLERADLVLVSLTVPTAERVSLDRLALLAAGVLRRGGIFAVYTHSDWYEGRLLDPTGAVVAAAQHADLLYLQHVVALHAPVRRGRLQAAPSPAGAAEYDRAAQRARVRGLPAPHLRVHGDVLAFAKPAGSGASSSDVGGAELISSGEPGHGGAQ